ncbi:hypothetical protein [Salinibacterium sp.]|uniref:hypothetical protein n=1 Tax=Salinibacterium sp. TaxID=1915057 RepID=UPI002869EF60|nr:hypothetical protein [Salinibacterium sp.]
MNFLPYETVAALPPGMRGRADRSLSARPGLDTEDIAKPHALNDIGSVAAAEMLFESLYLGDAMPDRRMKLLQRIFSIGLPATPPAPSAPKFD